MISTNLVYTLAASIHSLGREVRWNNLHCPPTFNHDRKKRPWIVFSILIFLASFSTYADGPLVLQPGDRLQIDVYDEAELSGEVYLDSKGLFQHSWLPPIKLSGMTIVEARVAIEEKLKRYLKKPIVKLSLAGVAKKSTRQTIQVIGAVKRMGIFPYREGFTAMQAIIEAGGFSKFASKNKAKLIRGSGEKRKVMRVYLGDVFKGRTNKDVLLQPGDILTVPEAGF